MDIGYTCYWDIGSTETIHRESYTESDITWAIAGCSTIATGCNRVYFSGFLKIKSKDHNAII